ncbi:uncharacterized protein LOC125645440 [Ostrea edulis]|uniref:uncharacterized protein LOC125645440 n=1 Tax=Ostrea edulis TaxID=37623 RepID=UPI002095A69A|nr:uncharacterized protein LOC125645440 [Ostrea edulis]XP_048726904.1 uncharacterized protein LOC125645440 [Ostrea edulis]
MNVVVSNKALLSPASAFSKPTNKHSKRTRKHQRYHERRTSTSSNSSIYNANNDKRHPVKKRSRHRRKMGTCTSKKKPKENPETADTEDVWKKRTDVPVLETTETGLYNFRRDDPLITELKSVLPSRNAVENTNVPPSTKGIKMADDSSSGSHGFVTPLSTPPVRRIQHPVFKVATPPPSRRVVESETSKISSPVLRRVKKQSEVVPPSPPPRYNEVFQTELPREVKELEAAPELPPRRNRLGSNKLSSPSLSRRVENKKDYLNTPFSKSQEEKADTFELKNNEKQLRCENCNSPVLIRKDDRAPTPPPRKTQVKNNQESVQLDSPSLRRAYPVFKIETPPPTRRTIETNKKKSEIQCSERPNAIENNELQSKVPHLEAAETQPLPSKENDSSRPLYSTISKPKRTEITPPGTIVRRRDKETDDSLVVRDDSRYLVRQEKTLSMEIEEENLRNYLREHAGKSSATMNVLPGPVLVKQCTLPSPARAVLTDVPPPSPNSLEILEEEEDIEDDEHEDKQDRKSKEMDEFNDIVCQRLSQLLETKEMAHGSDLKDYKENLEDNTSYKNQIDRDNKVLPIETVPPPPEYFDDFSLDLMNNNKQGNDAIENIVNKNEVIDCLSKDKNTLLSSTNSTRQNIPLQNKFNYKDYCQSKKQTSRGIQEKINLISEATASSGREDPDGISDKVVIEESIVPISIKRRSYEPSGENRQSNLLCDVIQSYVKPEESDIEKIMNEPVISKGTVNVQEKKKKSTSLDRKPSKLDQSLKKLFEVPVKEDTYDKLLPLESFLDDVMDQPLQSEGTLPYDPFDLDERIRSRRVLAGRQSVTRTESDIDISEPGDDWRDDISSDSNQADDEDEIESGEVVFSKSYPDTRRYSEKRQGRDIGYSAAFQQGTFQDGEDEVDFSDDEYDDVEDYDVENEDEDPDETLWIDEKHLERCDSEPVAFGADYYPMEHPRDASDVAYNSARRQMHEIHSHLLNLRDQMEYLADESENSNLKPSRCSGISVEKKS